MKKLHKSILAKVIIIGLIMYLIFEMILFSLTSFNRQSSINVLYQKSYTVQTQIENIFQSTITISDGYLSYMTSNLDASKEDSETFLDHILSYDDHYVKNIAMIEGTTIIYNYPHEENQSTIGIDLSTIEGQREDILFVKNNLEPLFVGPVDLVQGGKAFILRIPILDGDQYWGQLATVIDADLFIQTIENEVDINNVNMRIFYDDSDTDILLTGDIIEDNSVSTIYSNKYITWNLEVSADSAPSNITTDWIARIASIFVIIIISYFYYRSLLLNKKILHNAKHDSLTGDYNRAKFISDYNDNLFKGMLIAFTDVNKFKILNDTLGHSFGDWCLIQLSGKFNALENVRPYRISGDEFILVSTKPMSLNEFKKLMPSTVFSFYNEELKQEVDIEISLGVLETLIDTINLESILMYLDYAMYDAKKENKGLTIVNKELMDTYDETKIIEQQLIEDVRKNKLIPYYQPIINLETGKLDGFEVLSRWLYNDEIRSAAMFISVIKKVKYVDLLDRNLFDKLQDEYSELILECEQIKDMTFAINLSAETLMIFEKSNKRFDDFVKNRVIPIEKSIFEISEDINLGVISIETLRYIQSKGFAISVDDFGAGVSKLSDVLSGELKTIKTDKSLLPSKKANDKKIAGFYTIIKAIRASGSTICVEGVETVSQLEMSADAGCRLAQGYLFSKPIPKDQVVEYIKNFDYSKYQK
ncbi:Phytochrome-like protein cph2 [Candidatus Izimaplasma bacterium HR1]|jgi:diguanylate cyclase (GGDEF)-like protein|uniref:sensor domain-containing diguanylate cyclase n=1 Tax=Candidatus Izimoplasma sp. HR1 TaxID=1541959 RepID=UPI0004F724B8|nr:Phytochrome-like protein cph2 [Candidatus Izimaplasma bacterium HR1]